MALGPMKFDIPRRGPVLPTTPVWVHLELLYPRPGDSRRRTVGDGLGWTGRVRGELYRWWRTAEGVWLGQVTYELGYADGRDSWLRVEDQLIPATALSKRLDGKRIRHTARSLAIR
ncbi:MAG: hypothetical protein M3143_09760 [Actinomycetota bacterium]|nr:hypothetical protein [Actinomycetota bacterium]